MREKTIEPVWVPLVLGGGDHGQELGDVRYR
jgi:hypothetical protein